MSDAPPDSLFFPDLEDEEMAVERVPQNQQEGTSLPTQPEPLLGKRLFLVDSEDEDSQKTFAPLMLGSSTYNKGTHTDSDIEIPSVEDEPETSSVSNMSAAGVSTPSSPTHPIVELVQSPPKKRRISPVEPAQSTFSSAYLGSFLVGNAWSTVKGKGYVLPGDEVKVERDDPNESTSSKAKANKVGGKAKNADKGKTKQLSIATLLKPQQPKVAKKKVDSVVRLTNSRGFEFGRLPQDVASWVSRLLDMDIIEFRGSTMVDCPPVLHSGADLVVLLSVYLRGSAFKLRRESTGDNNNQVMFTEGQETLDEQLLRERKSSLLRLFCAIDLKPRQGVRRDQEDDKNTTELPDQSRKRAGALKKEVVGDGEEIEVDDGENLTENELDLIYKRAQENDRTMAEMEPADTFTLTLRGYQKQALLWMHSLETGTMSAREATAMHPLWSEYAFPPGPSDGIIDLSVDEQLFYFNPYSGELSLQFPKSERNCRGGILADVGMGKTIMLSALIQTNRVPEIQGDQEIVSNKRARQLKLDSTFRTVRQPSGPSKICATLIVAPTSLLSQWSEEIHRSSKPGTTKVLIWHGQNRLDLEAAIGKDNDDDETIKIVITSYGVLASEHAKSEKSANNRSPIFEIEWLRVVCDEAHHCKSRTSKTARAVYALRARKRWAVTGTPIVNKLEDLYSLLKFLGFAPWSDYSFFRSFITLPFLAHDLKAIEIVQVILESVVLRREKNMLDSDGNKIVELPPKEVMIEQLEFSPLERKIYDSIFTDAKRDFERLAAKGLVNKNYTHILAMLMRLRRAVLHPNLVLSPDNNAPSSGGAVDIDAIVKRFSEHDNGENVFAEGILANLGEDNNSECPICLDVMQQPMIIPTCMHQCCKDCIVAYLASCDERNEERRCPTCQRGPVNESELLEVVRPKKEQTTDDADSLHRSEPEVILRRNDFRSSTKLEALIQNLRSLQEQDTCFRAVVFSQFTSFLDLIEVALRRENFDQYRFDGSMDVKKRSAAVSGFKSPSTKPKILIVSLKAGGVGLNLTTANHVFMMDCWWNAATENQAIDRVHRIGQERTVFVKHFIIADTIEGRILKIQKRKTAIVKEAFRGKGNDKGGRDSESIENLKIMFGKE